MKVRLGSDKLLVGIQLEGEETLAWSLVEGLDEMDHRVGLGRYLAHGGLRWRYLSQAPGPFIREEES